MPEVRERTPPERTVGLRVQPVCRRMRHAAAFTEYPAELDAAGLQEMINAKL